MRPHGSASCRGDRLGARKAPSRLMFMTSSQSDCFMRTARPSRVTPALFHEHVDAALILQSGAKAALTDRGGGDIQVDGHCLAAARADLFGDFFVLLNLGDATTISNPVRQSVRAMARPMPQLAPVTKATRLNMKAPLGTCRYETQHHSARRAGVRAECGDSVQQIGLLADDPLPERLELEPAGELAADLFAGDGGVSGSIGIGFPAASASSWVWQQRSIVMNQKAASSTLSADREQTVIAQNDRLLSRRAPPRSESPSSSVSNTTPV